MIRWLAFLVIALIVAWASRPPMVRDPIIAAALSQLERRLNLLIAHLKKTQPEDHRVRRLLSMWDGRLLELKEHGAGSTINKKSIKVCVRDASGRVQDAMTAVFVLIHECAHVCTISEGHTPEFWENFRFMLREAMAAGIYQYQHFEKAPVTYCGSTITHSPLTCLREGTCH